MRCVGWRTNTRHTRIGAALRQRNYRLYFFGQLVSNSGTWVQRVAQDWVVLEITGSAFAVGVTTALQFLPQLLFGLYGGLIADRVDRRKLLVVSQAMLGLLAAVLAVITLLGTPRLWEVNVIATCLGAVTVVDNPARQIFVNELVPSHLLRNAIGLNSSTMQFARMAGPMAAGFLIAGFGAGVAFAINAASYGATIMALLRMESQELIAVQRPARSKGQIREGLRYVLSTHQLISIIALAFFIDTFGYNFPVLLTAYIQHIDHVSPLLFGVLNSILALGAFFGTLSAARRTGSSPTYLIVIAGTFAVALLAVSWAYNLVLFCIALCATGFFLTSFNTTANVSLQLAANAQLRGRVMSLFMLVRTGGTPIGAPFAGWVIAQAGFNVGSSVLALICLSAAVLVLLWEPRRAGT